ncbi:hypothetical protein [Nocardia nova]|uniref:hypothetical protein n=1 Tax=Nocardia nova TaxID=37330 RepID=UPI001894BC35|nr:hypothetical protein [Nocardia nova]MBF6277035.1 hypothetical protein [Nocardia nova]
MSTEPTVQATIYSVSLLPLDDINSLSFTVTVEYAGYGKWAVRRGRRVYDAAGVWDFEPMPSERGRQFLARYRHDLDAALAIARELASTLRVNGVTAHDILAEEAAGEQP